MKKSNIISQIAFAWGLGVISVAPVWAQTCIKTPSCADLGYTKTTTACAGKTILKCPLDTTKVYCPSYEEASKVYKVGDTYIDSNGMGIGTVIEIDETGRHGVVVTARGGALADNASEACLSLNAGGLAWFLAEGKYACAVKGYDDGDETDRGYYTEGCKICYVRTASGPGCCSRHKNGFRPPLSTSLTTYCAPSQSLAIYCQAAF